jgi:hypothetical protein
MTLWFTIAALVMLFFVTFLFSYRQRFPLNPVKTEMWALGVAVSSVMLSLLVISVVCIFGKSVWWGLGHLISLVAFCVTVSRGKPVRKPAFWIAVIVLAGSVLLSIPYAVIPFYRAAP